MGAFMSRPTKAVIVAAGRSSRLYPLTEDLPKGLLEIGGESMLGRSVRLLRDHGIKQIGMIVGFHRWQVQAHVGQEGITYFFNPFYAETNNMSSLWFAKNWVGKDPFLYLHSDIVYHHNLLAHMLAPLGNGTAALLVDVGPTDKEAMKVRVADGRFVESNKQIPPTVALGEWVGIAAFSAGVIDTLFAIIEQVLEERSFQAYDTEAFTRMAHQGVEFKIIPTEDRPWIEVDFIEDLERAREIFGI